MITSKFPNLPKVPLELPEEQDVIDYLTALRRRLIDELTIVRKTLERADTTSQVVAEEYEPDEIVQYSLPKRRLESTGYTTASFAPADHHILSATHGDTTAAAVVRGDIITGQGATPVWARLAKGAQYTILSMGADEPAWATRASLFGSGTDNYIPKFVVGATPTFGDSIMSNAVAGVISVEGDLTLNADALGENRTLTIEGWDGTDMAALTATVTTVGTVKVEIDGTSFIHETGVYTPLANRSLFIGRNVGTYTATGNANFGFGVNNLSKLSSGYNNCAIAVNSLASITTQTGNTAVGYSAGQKGAWTSSTLIGANVGVDGSGSNNTYIGYQSGNKNTGNFCTFVGSNAGASSSASEESTCLGFYSLYSCTTGDYHTAIGTRAGYSITTASSGVFLGYKAGYYETAASKLFIDNDARANEADGRVKAMLYGVFNAAPISQYLTVNGNLINQIYSADTNAVRNLFTLKHDTTGTPAAGFGAGILGQLESSTTASQDAAQIAWSWTDATHATRSSQLDLSTVSAAGALTSRMSVGYGGTEQVYIPGSTTNSTLRIGAMEFQNYGLNNNWIGDNVYYNSGFKYRADGYASLIRFYNGQVMLRAFASGTAGAAATEIDAFKTYNSGTCEATISLSTPALYVNHIAESTASHGIVLDNETYIGGTTNGVKIEQGGNLTLLGTATQWEDLRIEPVARTTGSNAPTFEKWYDDAGGTSRGVYLYSFDDAAGGSEKEIFFQMQMPHAWAGTAISMHVHWVGAVDDTTADPRWGLEYTWKDIGEVYGDTTIVYSDGTHMTTAGADANVTANKHYLTEFSDISPGTAADGLSSILLGRLFRDSANGADTYNATGAKCGLLYIDAHYEVNSFGSKEEYTK